MVNLLVDREIRHVLPVRRGERERAFHDALPEAVDATEALPEFKGLPTEGELLESAWRDRQDVKAADQAVAASPIPAASSSGIWRAVRRFTM